MKGSILSPTFVIGSIRIGNVEGASCVNMGNNFPTNFHSQKKHNQGFGSISGDHNQFHQARTALNDADVLDMFNDSSDEVPDWVKETVKASMTAQS